MDNEILNSNFYLFVDLPDYRELQEPLLKFCQERDVLGTILLAKEGINVALSGERWAVKEFYEFLQSDTRFSEIDIKEVVATKQEIPAFGKIKVRIRDEIVKFKRNDDLDKELLDLDMSNTGEYVKAEEWDDFIDQDDVIVIDTRNDYEVIFGTFEGAIDPKIAVFQELPEWVEKNLKVDKEQRIAMFCTGGIRCEKSTAYLKKLGYKNVYHLKGGVLRYLEVHRGKKSKWQGECFVFDNRVAVNKNLESLVNDNS